MHSGCLMSVQGSCGPRLSSVAEAQHQKLLHQLGCGLQAVTDNFGLVLRLHLA